MVLLLVLGLALAFAACGGGGGDNGASSANGDGDDEGGGGVTRAGTREERQFVADICEAYATFTTDVGQALRNPSEIRRPEDLTAKFAGPFGELAESFGRAEPPGDLGEWHAAAAVELTEVAARLERGNLDAAAGLGGNPIPDLPPDAVARLEAVAVETPACINSGFHFTSG